MIGLNCTESGKRVIDPNWRVIPGFDGYYEINRMGEVRSWRNHSHPGRAEKPKMIGRYHKKSGKAHGSCNRWLCVRLTKPDGKRTTIAVHHLMRDIWMKGKRPGMVVYHKNGDVGDPCLHNLDYIRRSDLGKKSGGKASRIPVAKISPDGQVVDIYKSAREAARLNYMSRQSVLDRCHNKVKNPYMADGYTYQFDY